MVPTVLAVADEGGQVGVVLDRKGVEIAAGLQEEAVESDETEVLGNERMIRRQLAGHMAQRGR